MVDFNPIKLVPIIGSGVMLFVIYVVIKFPTFRTDSGALLDDDDASTVYHSARGSNASTRREGGNRKSKRKNRRI